MLPCDFIPPPGLKFNTLLNAHRVHPEEPLVTALLYERGEAIKDGSLIFRMVVVIISEWDPFAL